MTNTKTADQTTAQHQEAKPFDWDLRITKDEIPDPQNLHFNEHAPITIPKVGITNLDLPINIKRRSGSDITVKGSVSAYVSLDSTTARGINMSRLARSFYDHVDGKGSVDMMDFITIVADYKVKLPAKDGYLKVRFDYPYKQKHWREDHSGWMYYPVEFEVVDVGGVLKTYLTVKYNYVSACPCSASLAEYSRTVLNTPAISHSQRSEAVIKMEFDSTNPDLLWIEDVIDLCRATHSAELLSGIVTRVGEFSMTQMTASETSFVEDMLRKFWGALNDVPRILDFSVGVCHFESLNQSYAAGFTNKSLQSGVGLS